MKEATLYDRGRDNSVHCRLCAHECTIAPGSRGLCGVRENDGGTLYALTYGRLVARDIDPIEKKPMFHFYPGSRAYSIATVGCNFTCQNCQNHFISQYPHQHDGRLVGDAAEPDEIVQEAIRTGCRSIAYTYTEPTIALEFYLEVMRRARAADLANVWVSNGYFSHDTADALLPWLDGINIDLKGISDEFYHRVVGGNVRPVLDSIERVHEEGVWVEVTTLVIAELNDSNDELRWTAEAIAGISTSIPWHVSRFFPAFRMIQHAPTPVETLERARRIGLDVGLHYVYLGNVPDEGEETHCPSCGAVVIRRRGYFVWENRLTGGTCPSCGAPVDGVWDAA
ncbi:MAG: AmmeMemoRadiSam system radical SAM enzyme [Candidatus Bipolaricaulota bacterium]|nr:AmmeMemoRadiSam system radical SAM enzyme [Candidatus Bipolaricaulota bacterium]